VASFFISLQHILCDVITSVGGSFEFGAMYLDSEGVLGDSNMDETSCAAHLNELLLEVEAKYGQRCPGGDLFFTWKDTLVSVALMDLESYGIPPFSERVCVILTSPRSHIYGPADIVQETNIFVEACGVVAVVVSAAMLVSSLYVAMVVQRSVWQDRRDADMDQVRAAESALKELSYPMCIIEAKDFLKMITWHSHEHWRDSGILIILDTLQDIREFQQTRSIVFISHQWLGYSQPDTEDNLQMRVMQRAVAVLQRYTEKELYVWLDYLSVAQRHLGLQQMAVNALPVYVSVVNSFLICAPEATHRDTGLPCGFHSYSERGWCRMEMLAKACGSGTSHIYVCRGDGVYLEELAVSQMNCLSFNVYEGVFTKESDKEMLVLPTLGLYSRVLRKEGDDVSMILMTMKAGINTFFPSHYIVELTDGTHQKRTLFGTVIRALEKHVQNTSDTTEGSGESTAGLSASLDAGRTWHLLDFDLRKETTPAPGTSSHDPGPMTQVLAV